MRNKLFQTISSNALEFGAYRATIIKASDISLDASFRALCESNSCGMYGKCYMCPPDIGDIVMLMSQISNYDYALVYQTVSELEDSFDFEGMTEAKKRTYPIAKKLRKTFAELNITHVLHLGAGGCGVCEVCAKRSDEPCRFPDLALPSLESYGINVSKLANTANMNYINGQNTVTYFGAVLFTLNVEEL